jgi:adenosylcobinamide-GDP ribazoletransferase
MVVKGWWGAVAFLTRWPVANASLEGMLWFFAPVGLVYGGLAYAVSLLEAWLPTGAVALLVVSVQVWVSGFLHLDGWADVWDAWAAPVERRDTALRSSDIGAAGAAALAVAVAALLVGTATALKTAPWAVWLAPVAGRVAMAGVVDLGPVRPDSRLLKRVRRASPRGASLVGAGILAAAAVVLGGGRALADAGAALALTGGFVAWVVRWLGGANGDVAGAAGVLAEMLVLWGGMLR